MSPTGGKALTRTSLGDGLGPPVAKLDTNEKPSAIRELSAHDTVLEELTEPEASSRSVPLAKWAWLCDFDRPITPKRPSKRPGQPKPAADALMATYER